MLEVPLTATPAVHTFADIDVAQDGSGTRYKCRCGWWTERTASSSTAGSLLDRHVKLGDQKP